jgi:hypothetical protein
MALRFRTGGHSSNGRSRKAVGVNWTAVAAGLLILAGARFGQAANSDLTADQGRVLEAVRASALAYSKRLPNFICTQITHRETRIFGDYAGSVRTATTSDVIEERLTYYGQQEGYQVISVNGRAATGLDRMDFSGTISAGEFGSALREIFDPESQTSFPGMKTAKADGRNAYVLEFRVPQENGAHVVYRQTGQSATVAYGGEIVVDEQTLEVLRIHSVLEMPKDSPIRESELTVKYKPVKIGEGVYMLPHHSEVRVKDLAHGYENEIDFKNYQKFTSESKIYYGANAPQ